MKPLIKDGNDLLTKFEQLQSNSTTCTDIGERAIQGFYVSSNIRNEVLTSESQGRIAFNGLWTNIKFIDLNDGLYKATLDILNRGVYN